MRTACAAVLASMTAIAAAFFLPACGGGESSLEVTINSPTEGEVLREEPFPVTGVISEAPPKSGVWLLVGNMADGQYYPVSSIAVDAASGGKDPLPWSAQFFNGVCQETFLPGKREVMVVRADARLLADIADSLALRRPLSRALLEENELASVVVDIQKPDTEFCLDVLPAGPQGPAPTDGTPPDGDPQPGPTTVP